MVEFFGFSLRLYGLIVALGIWAGARVAEVVAVREGWGREVVWDGLVWVAVFGLVGARAYHVIDFWEFYSRNLWETVAVWNGGLGIFGGLAGGLAGMWWFVGRLGGKGERLVGGLGKLSESRRMWSFLDLAAVGLPLGQAIGRWGNFTNQELYGPPSDLPWAVFIARENRLAGFEGFERFQPLFLYESFLSLGLFVGMWWLYGKSRKGERGKGGFEFAPGNGGLLGVYVVGYGLIRFGLEFLRLVPWRVAGGVPMAQVVSAGMVVGGGVLLARNFRGRGRWAGKGQRK